MSLLSMTNIYPQLKRKLDETGSPRPSSRIHFSSNDSNLIRSIEQNPHVENANSQSHIYDRHASILLVGLTGAGKKTLSVIAALALNRKYIEFDSFFEQQTSLLPVAYLQKHGVTDYRTKVLYVIGKLLDDHGQDHIISGFHQASSVAYSDILIRARATNPVIYIRRDKSELQKSISTDWTKFERWYNAHDAIHSSCCSHEFYNVSCTATAGQSQGTLKLKDAETDFIAFLQRISGRPQRLLYSKPALSASYTYALQAPLTWLESLNDYELLDHGADAVNLIVDVSYNSEDLHDRVAKQIAVLRRHTRASLIFEPQGPPGQKAPYLALLSLGARCLPDMVAINLKVDAQDLASVTSRNIKVIGCHPSVASWSRTHKAHFDLHTRVKELSCSALRLTNDAEEPILDNLECVSTARSLTRTCDVPVSTYNTTSWGRSSICFNAVLSPVAPHVGGLSGLTAKEAQMALYSSYVLEKKSFVIFGKSVSYSLSPAMHNAGYEASGMPHKYTYHQGDSFSDIQQLIGNKNCAGIAVSLPYKAEALSLLESVSPEAKAIGAVNTVLIKRTSSSIVLEGHNTDHIGVRQCIYQNLSPANSIRSTSSALIIGAGAMARAAIYACQTLGVKNICIYNRTHENALALAASIPLNVKVCESLQSDWPKELSLPTIIVSTVPAHTINGVPGFSSKLPMSWLQSRTGGVFVELAYKPLVTGLISQIQSLASRGWIAVDGLHVLLQQGIAQFEIFTGRPAPRHVMRRVIQEKREAMSRDTIQPTTT